MAHGVSYCSVVNISESDKAAVKDVNVRVQRPHSVVHLQTLVSPYEVLYCCLTHIKGKQTKQVNKKGTPQTTAAPSTVLWSVITQPGDTMWGDSSQGVTQRLHMHSHRGTHTHILLCTMHKTHTAHKCLPISSGFKRENPWNLTLKLILKVDGCLQRREISSVLFKAQFFFLVTKTDPIKG